MQPLVYTRAPATYGIRGLDLAAVGTAAITDNLSIHATVGAFYSHLKYSETGTDAPDGEPHSFVAPNEWRTDLSLGAGLSYRVTKNWTLHADWDRFRKIGQTFNLTAEGNGRFSNVDLFSFNVTYKFCWFFVLL